MFIYMYMYIYMHTYIYIYKHAGKNKTAYRITVRQLESLIRLSEGLARLHLDEFVSMNDVK